MSEPTKSSEVTIVCYMRDASMEKATHDLDPEIDRPARRIGLREAKDGHEDSSDERDDAEHEQSLEQAVFDSSKVGERANAIDRDPPGEYSHLTPADRRPYRECHGLVRGIGLGYSLDEIHGVIIL